MTLWAVITLVGTALGIVGMFVANWADNHPRHRHSSSTRSHDIAFAVGMIGWVIGVGGLVASLIDHFRALTHDAGQVRCLDGTAFLIFDK